MKNLYLLSTDKPSILGRFIDTNNLFLRVSNDIPRGENVNIYITSDEEIKEGDYVVQINFEKTNTQVIKCETEFQTKIANSKDGSFSKNKIILTTDQDLINDGVQEINDGFLEWFVKNPTCEFIDWDYKSNEFIQKEIGTLGHDEGLLQSEYDKYIKEYGAYEIIIPSVEQTKCYCGHTTYCDCSPLTETFKKNTRRSC